MAAQTDLAEMLFLDQVRLSTVLSKLEPATPRSHRRRKGLHRLNLEMGKQLGRYNARDRPTIVQAFAEADAELPGEITKLGSVSEAPEVEHIRQTGCATLGRILNANQIEEAHDYLLAMPVMIGSAPDHTNERFLSLKKVPIDKNYVCYDRLDLWSGPHLLEIATQERLLDLVQRYLGCAPTLQSINAFWSLPNRPPHHHSQVFHRDEDDSRSLTIFTLLTPVETPEEGAYYYVETSQEARLLEASLRADGVGTNVEYLSTGPFVAPMATRLFQRTARRFDGAAGTSFCADEYGLHRSVVPWSRPHLQLAIRFGTFFNEHVHSMRLSHNSRMRHIFRRVLPRWVRGIRAGHYERIERNLRRITEKPRHRYVFRYMVQALLAEL
jgi:hypothetical protein